MGMLRHLKMELTGESKSTMETAEILGKNKNPSFPIKYLEGFGFFLITGKQNLI